MAERLSFLAEWYQSDASIMRQFLLNFYPFDASVELVGSFNTLVIGLWAI